MSINSLSTYITEDKYIVKFAPILDESSKEFVKVDCVKTSDERNIKYISYNSNIEADDSSLLNFIFKDTELISSISYYLDVEMDEITDNIPLLDKLIKIIGSIPFADKKKIESIDSNNTIKENVMIKYGSNLIDASSEDIDPYEPEPYNIRPIINNFITGVSLYISLLDILLSDNIWNLLPFYFTVPYEIVDGKIFNKNMFKYLSIPFKIISNDTNVNSCLKTLISRVLNFMNIWGEYFVTGDNIDTVDIHIQSTSGYYNSVLKQVAILQGEKKKIEIALASALEKIELSKNMALLNINPSSTGVTINEVSGNIRADICNPSKVPKYDTKDVTPIINSIFEQQIPLIRKNDAVMMNKINTLERAIINLTAIVNKNTDLFHINEIERRLSKVEHTINN